MVTIIIYKFTKTFSWHKELTLSIAKPILIIYTNLTSACLIKSKEIIVHKEHTQNTTHHFKLNNTQILKIDGNYNNLKIYENIFMTLRVNTVNSKSDTNNIHKTYDNLVNKIKTNQECKTKQGTYLKVISHRKIYTFFIYYFVYFFRV